MQPYTRIESPSDPNGLSPKPVLIGYRMQTNGSEIVAWLSGSALVSINVVTVLWAGKYLDG